ncbi:hypothetical protein P3T76_010512 [Phytophthora citrophthora]|uniref:M96 mating-specific protein family n=1 Tax=Phytophthora citrophthora TaxID=4793 RepID=A0AAD9GC64_9STRA|nr:hypothetical protein P3T76_010512 [Phytophthora citrophthora]
MHLTTIDTPHLVRSERSHSLEFMEDNHPEPTLVGTESEMDIDIYTTDQLLGSVDVNTLLDEISTPRVQASGSKPTLLSAGVNYATLTETSDESAVSDDSDGPTSANSTLSVRTPTLVEEKSTLAKKPQSKSRKELILQQRNLLEELTVRLEELMSPPSRSRVESGIQPLATSTAPLWKLAAIRQLGRRRDAEEENVRLREMLELQVEEAKCLQRILKRRRKIQVRIGELRELNDRTAYEPIMMEDMLGMKRRKIGKLPLASIDNNQSFAEMIRDVDDLYSNLESTFASKGFDEMPCPGQKRKVDCNVVDGIFYERMQKTVIPFAIHETEKAVWKVLMDHGTGSVKRLKDFSNMVDFHGEQAEETCDTITCSYFAATPGNADASGAQVRKVVRKYTREGNFFFVCLVFMKPYGRSSTEAMDYRFHACLQIEVGSMDSPIEHETSILVINFSVRRQELGPTKSSKPRCVDFGIEVWDKVIPDIASGVENMLIDDALNLREAHESS